MMEETSTVEGEGPEGAEPGWAELGGGGAVDVEAGGGVGSEEEGPGAMEVEAGGACEEGTCETTAEAPEVRGKRQGLSQWWIQ